MTDFSEILEGIFDVQARLLMRVSEIERRNDNTVRHGKVTDVDAEKQLARIEIGERDGKPVKSAWLSYAQLAGDYKSHTPPTKGQQMTLFAPNGEIRQGVLLPFTWSNDNPSPSDKADEHVDTYGDKWKLTRKKDLFQVDVDGAQLKLTPQMIVLKLGQSEVEIKSGAINLKSTKIFTVGKTFVAVDAKDEETEVKVTTESGPAKQAFSKAE